MQGMLIEVWIEGYYCCLIHHQDGTQNATAEDIITMVHHIIL